jgi:dipeptidyl aminopeptidase/acylaminoacyl peptidase
VKLADALAKAGSVALRIDFRGRGDSEGATVDMTFDGDLSDARKALDYLEQQPDVDPKRLGLMGLSWGGAIASCLAGRDPRVSGVALWNTGATVHHWSPPLQEIEGRQVFEIWGNLIGSQFYDSLRQVFPTEDIKKARGPILIVRSTADEEFPPGEAEALKQAITGAGIPLDYVEIEGADHALMRYVWEKEAIEKTVDWFRRAMIDKR